MTHSIPLGARWMFVASLTLGGVALYQAEVRAQTVARARIQAAATTAPVTAPAEPTAPTVAPSRPPTAPTAPEGPRVRRLVVATGVDAREPVGAAESFTVAQTTPLYAFIELANPGAPESVRVRFVHAGASTEAGVGRVSLAVPTANRYRTWATTRMVRSPGAWAAVVETPEGRELARTPFTVR